VEKQDWVGVEGLDQCNKKFDKLELNKKVEKRAISFKGFVAKKGDIHSFLDIPTIFHVSHARDQARRRPDVHFKSFKS
jgi:hypothetical protein